MNTTQQGVRTTLKEKAKRGALTATAAAVLVGLMAQPASAEPTPVDISVSSEAYAPDGAGHVTASGGFLYDPSRGDTAADAYDIAYRGILDMRNVWTNYQTFRTLWLIANGFDTNRYQTTKTFSGSFAISFTVDTSVVEADTSFVSCDFVQSAMEEQNPSTRFSEIMQCRTATYDPATGVFTATFELGFADGSKVYGRDLDNAAFRPNTFTLTTPPAALYVPQSNFEAGRTFAMTNPTVTGQMQMDAFFVGMPLTFNDVGDPVSLTMYPTYSAGYQFVACDAGSTLPSSVTDLTPPTEYMYVDGDVVTGPALGTTSVAGDRGSWIFQGWDSTPTIAGEDVTVTGCWDWEYDPNALWNVSYRFIADDGMPLPTEVTDSLPPSVADVTGTVIPAPIQARSLVAETTVNGDETVIKRWTFDGWDRESVEIATQDEVVTGMWLVSTTTYVPAVAPTYVAATQCGVEPTVTLPTTSRLTYTSTRTGSTLSVAATAPENTVITSAITEWEFNMATEACGIRLPVTGADVPLSVAWTGLALLLLGSAAVVAGTRRRSAQ